jgi:hypothetical protein
VPSCRSGAMCVSYPVVTSIVKKVNERLKTDIQDLNSSFLEVFIYVSTLVEVARLLMFQVLGSLAVFGGGRR